MNPFTSPINPFFSSGTQTAPSASSVEVPDNHHRSLCDYEFKNIITSALCSNCAQTASELCLDCAQGVSKLHPKCVQNISELHSDCVQMLSQHTQQCLNGEKERILNKCFKKLETLKAQQKVNFEKRSEIALKAYLQRGANQELEEKIKRVQQATRAQLEKTEENTEQ